MTYAAGTQLCGFLYVERAAAFACVDGEGEVFFAGRGEQVAEMPNGMQGFVARQIQSADAGAVLTGIAAIAQGQRAGRACCLRENGAAWRTRSDGL